MNSTINFNATNSSEIVSNNSFTIRDRIIASLITIFIGIIGLIFHLFALNSIRKIKEYHNVYGYLCVTNSISAIVLMLLFVFYCAPVTMEFYSNISEYWTHRIGQILLFFYFVTLYTHVGIAINRYFAVCRPLQYRKSSSWIFSVLFVLLVWLAGFLHILPLFFGVQSFYFHDDSLLFYYGDDEFSQFMAHYIDFIYGCSIMGIVFLLDCVTLLTLRHLLKSHNQNIGKAKTAERNNIKKEVLFFIQAFLNMACFVVLLIFFHLVYKLVDNSKWGSFFTTTFAWVTMHAVDGIVLASFSYIYSKKKGIACLGSKVTSTTSNLIVPKIKVSKVSDELARLWNTLETRGEFEQEAAILDYLDVNENLTTEEDPLLNYDEETVNIEAEELNSGLTEELTDLMDFYVIDEE